MFQETKKMMNLDKINDTLIGFDNILSINIKITEGSLSDHVDMILNRKSDTVNITLAVDYPMKEMKAYALRVANHLKNLGYYVSII